MAAWKHFLCSRSQLSIDTVLGGGQSFRWKINNSGEWLGVMADLVWRLKQTDDRILYQVYGPDDSTDPTGLESVPGYSELKQENSPGKRNRNSHEAVLTTELSQDETKHIGYNDDKACSRNDYNIRQRKGQQKIRKEICKQNKNEQKELLQVEASSVCNILCQEISKREDLLCQKTIKNEDLLCPKTIKNEDLLCPNTIKREDTILPTPQSDSNCTKDGLLENFHYSLLHNYFQLGIDLNGLYDYWASKDPHFKKIGGNFQGVRLLRLHPTECLLSFVCSANNHISRISSMVEKLCTHYGDLITSVDGIDYYTFPCLSNLCGDGVESHLRELGFGYRAKYIASIARHVTNEKGDRWLESLRGRSYSEAKMELMSLLGVGAKVADCVCLMSLDKPEALPVDTHIWQLTLKNYIARLHNAKSLTEKIYNEIGDFYRSLWGPYAGWAQAVMFASSLSHKKMNERSSDQVSEGNADNQDKIIHANKRKGKQSQKTTKEGNKKKK